MQGNTPLDMAAQRHTTRLSGQTVCGKARQGRGTCQPINQTFQLRGVKCQGQKRNDSVKSAETLCRNSIKTRYVSTTTIISNQQGYGNRATAGSATGCQQEERRGPICTSGPRLTTKYPATLTGTTGVNRQGNRNAINGC